MSSMPIEMSSLHSSLDIFSIISSIQPSTIEYLLNNAPDFYSYLFERHSPLTLNELFQLFDTNSTCFPITEFLLCSILQRAVQEAPIPMMSLARVIAYFNLLCTAHNHRPQDLSDSLRSILLVQISSADSPSDILGLAALLRYIHTQLALDPMDLLAILSNNFEISLTEFALKSTSRDYIEALEWIIKCERLGLVSRFGKVCVLLKAIEFVQETHDHFGVNRILGVETGDFGGASYINGLLKLVEIEDEEIKRSRDLICEKYEARVLLVKETLYENSMSITIEEKEINNKVTHIKELEVERDCFRQTTNSKKTISTYMYKGTIIRNGTIAAIKKITVSQIEDLDRFYKEIEILKKLSGQKFFLEYYGAMQLDKSLFIIMEYVEKSLMDVMLSDRERFTEIAVDAIAMKLIEAYSFLESKKIFHRDVKPENILMRHGYDPVIIDFGISDYKDIELNPGSTVTSAFRIAGTEDYMSPEVFEAKEERNSSISISSLLGFNKKESMVINPIKSDVYSLGITLFQLCTGEDLRKYQGKSGNRMLLRDVDQKVNSPSMKAALSNMLQYDPKNRRRFTHLLAYFITEKTVAI